MIFLDEDIKIEEIVEATASLKTIKAPGPDGFPSDFYKHFLNAYHPISLLNCDYIELQTLHRIISPDQNGFVRDRHSFFFNIKCFFNVLYSPHSNNPKVVVSLDVEKAFDLINVLERFRFGLKFISWIKLLYATPKASVRSNNIISDPFPLNRGTWQGCPLSPLLFAIAIEPLVNAVHTDSEVQGIFHAGLEQVSSYVDDLILFMSNPLVSIPTVLLILESFSTFSGCKLNFSKSELFPVNSAALSISYSNFHFRVVNLLTCTPYFGTHS